MGRVLGRVILGLCLLIALFAVVVIGIDTGPGHGLVTRIAAGIKPQNGLRFTIGRIDGSIYDRMTLRAVVVRDPKGVVATIPAVTIDWHPTSLFNKRIRADEVTAPLVTVLKRPELLPTPPGPLLPDIAIAVRRLAVDRLILAAPVTGKPQEIALTGTADIADGRAQVSARATAVAGDRLTLRLDAVPDADRFDIDAHIVGPVGGVIDGLAKLGKPIVADVAGKGSWTAWSGTASARLAGAPLLDVTLTATDGRFAAKGTARPGLVMAGPVARLTAPALAIDATATAANRIVDTRVRLTSDALAVSGTGRIDLGAGRYGGLRVDGQLLRPGAILDDVRGRDVRVAVVLDGPFATPTVDYTITAAALGFGTTAVETLRAHGVATVDAERIALPLHLTASRVVGIQAASGGLLRNVRIDGDISVTAKQVASDNLRLRSDQIDATVVAAASLATGEYTAALKGRVNRYELPGIGVVDLVTDARLVPAGRGQFRVRGNVRATTARIDNPSAREFLGGNAIVTAAIDRSADGLIAVGSLRVTAPKFKVTSGQGSYRPDGRIAFTATGASSQYGPLAVNVGGTVSRPLVTLRAARPNVGVQLTDVEAVLRPAPGGYAVTARGGSPYGPFAVDVGLRVGHGPLVADVRRASIAGLILTGQVRATAAGPYAGTLTLSGQGLNGTIQLAAAGSVQRADVALRANNARIPLRQPILIAQGSATATAILYPDAPSFTGQGSFTGIRQGELTVAALKAAGDYRNGSGKLDLNANGATSVPFAIAVNAGFSPNVIRVNGTGSVNAVALRLAAPAEIVRERGGYRLQPATLLLPAGRVTVSGAYGPTTSLNAVLQGIDLSIIEAFKPGLGLAGTASGTIEFALPERGGTPSGRANLTIAGLTRSGLTTVSTPVNVAMLGTLSGAGAEANAVIRRGSTVLGHLKTTLSPLPGTAAQPWSERLLAAPLGGGIRYNGPAELLWALTGIGGQELAGPIAIGADFGGHLSAPQVRGLIRGKGLRYENSQYGSVIDRIDLDSRFVDTRLQITSLTGRAGDGTVTASGFADLSADKGFPIDVRVQLARARLARSNALDATISGSLAVTNSVAAGAQVSGDLNIIRARYAILRPAAAEVVELEGVRRKNAPPPPPAPRSSAPSVWKLNVNVRADNEIFVSGMGLEAEWRTNLKIGGTATQPVIVGTVNLVRGTYGFAGRSFALSRGIVRFAGEVPFNPTLDIAADTTVEGLTATVAITGRAFAPEIAFTSTPALAQDEVLSRLLFGTSVTSLTPTQALQLAASLNTLRGSTSANGFNPLGTLRKATGIDRLRVLGADKTTGAGPSVAAGKYISNRIYVEVVTDARGNAATQIEIAISKVLRILSSVSSFGGSNLSIRYSKDY